MNRIQCDFSKDRPKSVPCLYNIFPVFGFQCLVHSIYLNFSSKFYLVHHTVLHIELLVPKLHFYRQTSLCILDKLSFLLKCSSVLQRPVLVTLNLIHSLTILVMELSTVIICADGLKIFPCVSFRWQLILRCGFLVVCLNYKVR